MPTAVKTIETQEPHNILSVLERVLVSPDLPIERLTALMEIQERQLNKEAEQNFNIAFSEAMAEMPSIPKTAMNNHTGKKYSTLDDIVSTTRPVLSKFGLALNFNSSRREGMMVVTAIVRHTAGHKEHCTLSAPATDGQGKASMNEIQAAMSTDTYLKRAAAMSILGLSSGDEVDDDGQAAATITEAQFIQLRDALEASRSDENKFLKAYRAKSLEQFPATKFDAAMAQIAKKVEKNNGTA